MPGACLESAARSQREKLLRAGLSAGQPDWPCQAPTAPLHHISYRLAFLTGPTRRRAGPGGLPRSPVAVGAACGRAGPRTCHRQGSLGAGPARSGDFAPGWRSPTAAATTPFHGTGNGLGRAAGYYRYRRLMSFLISAHSHPAGEGGTRRKGASSCSNPRGQFQQHKWFTRNRVGRRQGLELSLPDLNYWLLRRLSSAKRSWARLISFCQAHRRMPPDFTVVATPSCRER